MNTQASPQPFNLSELTSDSASTTLLLCEFDLDEGSLEAFEEVLTAEEQAAANRRANPQLRSRFIRARGALRRVLGALTQSPPRSLPFERGEFGKPTLRSGPSFNLSHSEGAAILAVSSAEGMTPSDLGVDLEHVRDWPDLDDLAQTVYTPPEREWRNAKPSELARRSAFFRLWTAKESFMKATGEGLSRPLQEFQIEWDEHERDGRVRSHPAGADLDYFVFALPGGNGIEASLCLRTTWKNLPLRRVALSFRDGPQPPP